MDRYVDHKLMFVTTITPFQRHTLLMVFFSQIALSWFPPGWLILGRNFPELLGRVLIGESPAVVFE